MGLPTNGQAIERGAVPTLADVLKTDVKREAVLVAPDAGAVRIANEYAHRLACPIVVLHKRRASAKETRVTHLIGEVRGRPCVIVDDMISTGGNVAEAIATLLAADAMPDITVVATHGILVGKARERLSHPAVRRVLVTDTLPVMAHGWPELRVTSIAPVIAALKLSTGMWKKPSICCACKSTVTIWLTPTACSNSATMLAGYQSCPSQGYRPSR